MDGDTWARLAWLVVLLMAVGSWVIVEYRKRMGQALRTFLAWGLIFVGLAAGYGLWQDIRTEVIPRQAVSQEGEVTLRRAADGHFYASIEIDGTEVLFLADTGATNLVLSRKDAQRLGIDLASLAYLGEAWTANGPVRTARVTLHDLRFGPFTDDSFTAWVNDGEMDNSLLGMDYLKRFSIRIEGERMVLTR